MTTSQWMICGLWFWLGIVVTLHIEVGLIYFFRKPLLRYCKHMCEVFYDEKDTSPRDD